MTVASATRKPVLIVDDEVGALALQRATLEIEGFPVVTAMNPDEAVRAILDHDPSLVLLDVMLPGMDGFTLCKRIRQFSNVPIIMVTGKGTNEDKVEGLEAGADDYITKPFSPKEMVARVTAALRRATLSYDRSEETVTVGDLVVDIARNRVTVANRELILSATEFRLLGYLARNSGRVLTPDQILQHVWGDEYTGDHHLLRVTIGRLRRKLGDLTASKYISTRRGIGYSLVASKGR